MSATDHADELLARIFAYMVRAAHNPAMINRAPREMGAIVTAWRILRVMAPGLLPFGAEQFQRYLLTKGAEATAGAIISWTQSRQGQLSEPAMPPANATESELLAYKQSFDRYSKMIEMMARITANRREMQKAVVGNFPR
jgi:hypothetical protein